MGGIVGGSDVHINNTEPMALGIRIQTSAYGLVIPLVYGRTRVTGNLISYGDFTPIAHTTSSSSGGGKGGGGEVTTTNTTYTYTARFMLGIGQGPFTSINSVWADKKYTQYATQNVTQYALTDTYESFTLPGSAWATYGTQKPAVITVKQAANFVSNTKVIYGSTLGINNTMYGFNNPLVGGVTTFNRPLVEGRDYSVNNGVYTFNQSLAGQRVTIYYKYNAPYTLQAPFIGFLGTYTQNAWTFMTTNHPDEALAYRGIGYVASSAYDLGNSPSLPNHSFDVTGRLPFNVGTIDDANPKDIVVDLLTNSHYGVGYPSAKIGDLTQFSNYCVAYGLFLSPAYTDQKGANEILNQLAMLTNSAVYYSEGLLKIVPMSDTSLTANGVTFTANVTPLYNLGEDDYIITGDEDPVRLLRNSSTDAYNQVQIEFVNRANDYNVEVIDAKDQVSIDDKGLRPMDAVEAHEIAAPSVAKQIAQLLLQRSLYVRNTYEFRLSWKYSLVEPSDYLTLTDSNLGLNLQPVRVLSVEEDESGMLKFTAEEAPVGISSNAFYESQSGTAFTTNFNQSAGNTSAPVIFEAPDVLTTAGLEVWVAASGVSDLWGGCQVWISTDNVNYQQVGVITNPGKQGVLLTTLPLVADPDTTSTLSVDMSLSGATLSGGSQANVDDLLTLSYVDGELIAYRDATLISTDKYNLTYLRRGAYNSTIGSHIAGTQFLRIDSAVFKYPFTADRIGLPYYIKLPSFNVYGGGIQNLADVDPITYNVVGSALQSSLPNIQNITTNFVAGLLKIYWDEVVDFRQPNVDYEIRLGTTWASGSVVGRTPLTEFTANSPGTYWIAAHYQTSGGINAYSQTPQAVVISAAILTKNVIASFDEQATGWSGTLSSTLAVIGTELWLLGTGNILTEPDFLNIPNVIEYGGVAPSGTYEVPVGHYVSLTKPASCLVSIGYLSRGQSVYDNVLTITDFLNYQDVLGTQYAANITVTPQIALAQDDGIYGAWQTFVPGVYLARYFKARLLVESNSAQIIGIVQGMTFSVDVPDRIDNFNLTTLAGGSTVSYTAPFNGGPGGLANPLVQITIVNATAGDDVVLTAQTTSGFTVQVFNGGVGVARQINVLAQGY